MLGGTQPSRLLQPKATRGQERIPEYPIVKRRRPTVIACHHCRMKKIRCDGQRPACSSCVNKGVKCSYRDTMHASRASRESVPGVVHMLGQLCASELVHVIGRLKNEADTETILSTIKGSLAKGHQQRDSPESTSTVGSEDLAHGPKTPNAPVNPVASGAEMNWFWPAPCQPTAEFAMLNNNIPGTLDEYWSNRCPRPWTRFPNDF